MKKHLLIQITGLISGIFIFYFIVLSEDQIYFSNTIYIGLFGLSGVLTSYMLHFTSVKLDGILSWHTQLGNRLLIGILFQYFISFCFFYAVIFLFHDAIQQLDSFDQIILKTGIILFIFVLIYSVFYFGIYSYHSFVKIQIETVQNNRKQIELQLKSLKSQLSPHFLFNNLNTISSLIYKDGQKAVTYIRNFAKLYIHTLETYQTKLVSLETEINLVINYCYLLQTRFEHKFKCEIKISDSLLSTQIPPLTLQMLVENAVKHNQLSSENPLSIEITHEGKFLQVKNNITDIPNNIHSFNIGLKNINKRYILLCNKGIVIQKNSYFTVQIPIIK